MKLREARSLRRLAGMSDLAMVRYLDTVTFVLRNRWLVLAFVGALLLAAAAIIPRLQFDMSFRPLFSTDPALNAATRKVEKDFSQSSVAYIVAILEGSDLLKDGPLGQIRLISESASRLPHVSEVISVASFMVPKVDENGPRIVDVPDLLRLRAAISRHEDAVGKALAQIGELRGVLISADGRKTLVLARIDIPLSDLSHRRPVMDAFKDTVRQNLPDGAVVHFTGVSVVEDAYARLVLRNMLVGVGLTVLSIALALYLFIGGHRSVVIALAGVSVATPVTLAMMVAIGQPMTIVNSMVATMVLIIGVADAIHMEQAFGEQLDGGKSGMAAVLGMMQHTAVPCLMTSVTTALGFLSLCTADMAAVRSFGVCVALGVAVVFVLNQLLVPVLCLIWPPRRRSGTSVVELGCDRWMASASTIVAKRSLWLVCGLLVLAAGSVALLPRLEISQRFNEELAADHPVRVGQRILEQDFGGILGPDLVVRRRDGGPMFAAADTRKMVALQTRIKAMPGVLSVKGPADYLVDGVDVDTLLTWRQDSPLASQLRDVLSADGRGVMFAVRIADIGTSGARVFHDRLLDVADQELGNQYVSDVAGQWWLAQRGMMNILDNMIKSLLASGILILPLLFVVLRSVPLLVASLAPNILPILVALAYMAASGITLRIGTAMVLAGTIGIAFDDTVHFILRLNRELRGGLPPLQATQATIRSTGKAVLLTTLVLLGGFLSMLTNDLRAIRDMGQVAAIAFFAGFIADLYLAPAVYLVLSRRSTRQSESLKPMPRT